MNKCLISILFCISNTELKVFLWLWHFWAFKWNLFSLYLKFKTNYTEFHQPFLMKFIFYQPFWKFGWLLMLRVENCKFPCRLFYLWNSPLWMLHLTSYFSLKCMKTVFCCFIHCTLKKKLSHWFSQCPSYIFRRLCFRVSQPSCAAFHFLILPNFVCSF